jgi:hypothetical protein
MKTTIKTNGFTAEDEQDMIYKFERAAEKLFPDCTINHFYYGNHLDMADLLIAPRGYAHFNITKNRVSLCGYTCSSENLAKLGSLTYRDECYNGRLFELA